VSVNQPSWHHTAPLIGPRTVTRILVVVGLLLFAITWRLDQAVGTAYATGWFAPEEKGTTFACENCLRLPTSAWVHVYWITTLFAFAFLLVAAILWWRRCARELRTTQLRRTTIIASFMVAGCAVGAALTRSAWSAGDAPGRLGTLIAVFNVAGLAVTAAIAIAAANLIYRSGGAAGSGSLTVAVRRFVGRQRMTLLVVFLLVLALTAVPTSSGQAIDSIRSWSPFSTAEGEIDWLSVGAERLAFGLASTLLLALVIYESALLLTQAPAGTSETPPLNRLLVAVLLLAGGGVLLWWLAGFGPGLFLAGALIGLTLLLDRPQLEGTTRETKRPHLTRAEEHAPEWLAVLLLLAVAATSVAAAVDTALVGGLNVDSGLIGLPALVLALVAIVMTSEHPPPRVRSAAKRSWLAAIAIVVGGAIVLMLLNDSGWSALLGVASLVALIAYTVWAFRWRRRERQAAGPRKPLEGPLVVTDSLRALATPFGLGAAVAVALAVHVKPIATGQTLGVFVLANVAVILLVLLFHVLVRGTLRYRPPKLLWWFGFRQLPLLSLLVIWWIGVGLIGSETLHDVRVVDRRTVATSGDGEYPARHKLADAFRQWTAAQPELRADEAGTPVPLTLVAAHGGGIRAAYWTVAALDCIVGVRATGTGEVAAASDDKEVRARTCEKPRRTKEQQRDAARRIFLASGVSGGAVGLYAYIRQLLAYGELKQGWFDTALKHDFAAPAVGWALFHDIPNRAFGLRPESGGRCRSQASVGNVCWTADRAAVLEDAFDSAWAEAPGPNPYLRHTYDLRLTGSPGHAVFAPLFVANSTLTGGKTRAVISAVDLGAWPNADKADYAPATDPLPLAGTIELSDALCNVKDLRLSTAALLAARFPYVTPSGHIAGGCGEREGGDRGATCVKLEDSVCEGSFVDGGYTENSGLLTILTIWPSLRNRILAYNNDHTRDIAVQLIELDNHYQATPEPTVPSGGTTAESLIPPLTAFGGRNALQTYARAAVRRLLPESCTITLSPSLHPGLIAPLGWELSESAREDLKDGLVRPHPAATEKGRDRQIKELRRLQSRMAGLREPPLEILPPLTTCLP
jgi:Ca2+/Na+ antiporter